MKTRFLGACFVESSLPFCNAPSGLYKLMLFVCVEIPRFWSCTALQWPTLRKISVSASSMVCAGACARERTSSGSFKQACHVGRCCCQTEDKSENVNWIRRNVCQTFWRWPLHCDYRHLIFMRAYLPAETTPNWLLLLECVGKRFPCDKTPNDVTAMWHYERVNMCHPVYSVTVSQVNSTRGKRY